MFLNILRLEEVGARDAADSCDCNDCQSKNEFLRGLAKARQEQHHEPLRTIEYATIERNQDGSATISGFDADTSGDMFAESPNLAFDVNTSGDTFAQRIQIIAATAAQVQEKLTRRDFDVLRCLAQGDSNKLIARRLEITESTVKVHMKGLLRKLSVINRTQAAIAALILLGYVKPNNDVVDVEEAA